jgi:hypothetical protein
MTIGRLARFSVVAMFQLLPVGPAKGEKAAMDIRITFEGRALDASLVDGPAARDFYSLLPLTLTLEDYAKTEKIAYLPRKLSTTGEPRGIDPDVGDITYYAPWGNLAIFHKDFGYSEGLVKLGRISSGIEFLGAPGKREVTIQRSKPGVE